MKKVLKTSLALLMALGLTACSKPAENPDQPEGGECPVKIGLVTDLGGVDDRSFNQSAWEGIKRFAADNKLGEDCYTYLQSTADADYEPNLKQLVDDGYDLVIACGFLFFESIGNVSKAYPDAKFLFVDEVSDSANVMNAVFGAEQGSFLVGVAAALKAQDDGKEAVGFIGGMEGPTIGAFQAGFEQGVQAIDPDMTIYVDYTASFVDDAIGQTLAVKQYNAGVDVIYQAAGNSGNGVIKEAKERGDVWAIGVDKDQYDDGIVDGGNSIILTSMIKRVDSATYAASEAVLNGTFTGGTTVFDLPSGGVSAELTEGRNLTDSQIATIQEYAEKITSGEIEVSAEPQIANGKTNKDA